LLGAQQWGDGTQVAWGSLFWRPQPHAHAQENARPGALAPGQRPSRPLLIVLPPGALALGKEAFVLRDRAPPSLAVDGSHVLKDPCAPAVQPGCEPAETRDTLRLLGGHSMAAGRWGCHAIRKGVPDPTPGRDLKRPGLLTRPEARHTRNARHAHSKTPAPEIRVRPGSTPPLRDAPGREHRRPAVGHDGHPAARHFGGLP